MAPQPAPVGTKESAGVEGLININTAPLCVLAQVPLEGAGTFALGEDCEIAFRREGSVLRLEVARGLDKGTRVLLGRVLGQMA